MKYQRKPMIIDAMRWEPSPLNSPTALLQWIERTPNYAYAYQASDPTRVIVLHYEGGSIDVNEGDWLILTHGEFDVLHHADFESMFEPAVCGLRFVAHHTRHGEQPVEFTQCTLEAGHDGDCDDRTPFIREYVRAASGEDLFGPRPRGASGGFQHLPKLYLALVLQADGTHRYATVEKPRVPKGLVQPGEVGFIIEPLDMVARQNHEVPATPRI